MFESFDACDYHFGVMAVYYDGVTYNAGYRYGR